MLKPVTELGYIRLGYKILYSVCAHPTDALPLGSQMLCLSREVAVSEEKAAMARDKSVASLAPLVAASAEWMAEVVARADYDFEASDSDQDGFDYVKQEYTGDFSLFGMTLLGILLEEGLVTLK